MVETEGMCPDCGHAGGGIFGHGRAVPGGGGCDECPTGDWDQYDERRGIDCQFCCSTWASFQTFTKHVTESHPEAL